MFYFTFLTGINFVRVANFFAAPASTVQLKTDLQKLSGYAETIDHSNRPYSSGQIKILSLPKAVYNDGARDNGVEGTVRLKVEFLNDGTIGHIIPVTELPYGLTEQAIKAARNIKFDPFEQDGGRSRVVKTIEYNFTIY